MRSRSLLFVLIVALGVVLVVVSCGGGDEASAAKGVIGAPIAVPAPVPAPARPSLGVAEAGAGLKATSDVAQALPQERLVVRTISMTALVSKVEDTLLRIARLAEEMGGFVVSTNRQGDGRDMSGFVSFRVPAEKTEEALGRVRDLAVRVTSESSNAQDVTEEYVDLQARLRNLRATEDQYLALLQRAQTVEDALKVQQALSSVRGEIERLEGRVQYLERTARTSLITVQLLPEASQEPLVRPGWSPRETFKDAVRSLTRGLQNLADFGIRLVTLSPFWLVPLILLGALVVVLRRRARRH